LWWFIRVPLWHPLEVRGKGGNLTHRPSLVVHWVCQYVVLARQVSEAQQDVHRASREP